MSTFEVYATYGPRNEFVWDVRHDQNRDLLGCFHTMEDAYEYVRTTPFYIISSYEIHTITPQMKLRREAEKSCEDV